MGATLAGCILASASAALASSGRGAVRAAAPSGTDPQLIKASQPGGGFGCARTAPLLTYFLRDAEQLICQFVGW